jgi:aminoglycoside phosphotransferase (APT) family kinase protein
MHHDQLEVTAEAVAALVADQFPEWAHLSVSPVPSHGTVHLLFRLGEDLVARLRMQEGSPEEAYAAVAAEQAAARRLLGRVPVRTPEPVATGTPGPGYPLPWSVYRWLPGTVAGEHLADSEGLGRDLAAFVAAVREIDTGGQVFDRAGRGGRLTDVDGYVDDCLAQDTTPFVAAHLRRLWERLRLTSRTEADTMTHGDLMPGNLLLDQGRLSAVIDVATVGPADPALDLQPAWNLLAGDGRAAFRAALCVGDEQWQRGMGWAYAQAIGCLDYYRATNPVMSQTAVRTLRALLEDDAHVSHVTA